jgi:hypothetical protein
MVLGRTDAKSIYKRMQLDFYFIPYAKTNSKCVTPKYIKLLEENIGS